MMSMSLACLNITRFRSTKYSKPLGESVFSLVDLGVVKVYLAFYSFVEEIVY